MKIKTGFLTVAAVVALTGCTYNDGAPNRPVTGAVIGGATGAAIGNAIGDDTKATVIGGAIGAAVGGAIGANMARQERELNQQLAGSGATITNTGSQLRVILPEGVTFATGSATVAAGFRPSLREVARSLKSHPNSTVRVVGHTDNVGSAAYNQQLSEDRALAVARILIRDGVSSSRITYSGRGYYEPITSNATVSGRAQNRRVEVVITPTN
ncbi:OmpA family protein [Lutimaribacter sp. EGI FJ00015]|uniref:OmpA family protein n=1 Tax=Lutimaribacter degradans TaxID=2945989 RepID=A0ACC5ZV15_9RHOB|nr:OmpA family protein [Lutimaribacter sp. EGI FJ00013]MCM2561695.1 OmpA family protein [Lutimaribacter sp. EGI FJ00013]MCO0612592.1 OmpA family protein [Lutimaribacter sp. EGI FJ00015]MCO0635251.1 OmpA family protein [Lutimaribacter sp. EGI FJ00014]